MCVDLGVAVIVVRAPQYEHQIQKVREEEISRENAVALRAAAGHYDTSPLRVFFRRLVGVLESLSVDVLWIIRFGYKTIRHNALSAWRQP